MYFTRDDIFVLLGSDSADNLMKIKNDSVRDDTVFTIVLPRIYGYFDQTINNEKLANTLRFVFKQLSEMVYESAVAYSESHTHNMHMRYVNNEIVGIPGGLLDTVHDSVTLHNSLAAGFNVLNFFDSKSIKKPNPMIIPRLQQMIESMHAHGGMALLPTDVDLFKDSIDSFIQIYENNLSSFKLNDTERVAKHNITKASWRVISMPESYIRTSALYWIRRYLSRVGDMHERKAESAVDEINNTVTPYIGVSMEFVHDVLKSRVQFGEFKDIHHDKIEEFVTTFVLHNDIVHEISGIPVENFEPCKIDKMQHIAEAVDLELSGAEVDTLRKIMPVYRQRIMDAINQNPEMAARLKTLSNIYINESEKRIDANDSCNGILLFEKQSQVYLDTLVKAQNYEMSR